MTVSNNNVWGTQFAGAPTPTASQLKAYNQPTLVQMAQPPAPTLAKDAFVQQHVSIHHQLVVQPMIDKLIDDQLAALGRNRGDMAQIAEANARRDAKNAEKAAKRAAEAPARAAASAAKRAEREAKAAREAQEQAKAEAKKAAQAAAKAQEKASKQALQRYETNTANERVGKARTQLEAFKQNGDAGDVKALVTRMKTYASRVAKGATGKKEKDLKAAMENLLAKLDKNASPKALAKELGKAVTAIEKATSGLDAGTVQDTKTFLLELTAKARKLASDAPQPAASPKAEKPKAEAPKAGQPAACKPAEAPKAGAVETPKPAPTPKSDDDCKPVVTPPPSGLVAVGNAAGQVATAATNLVCPPAVAATPATAPTPAPTMAEVVNQQAHAANTGLNLAVGGVFGILFGLAVAPAIGVFALPAGAAIVFAMVLGGPNWFGAK